MSNPVCGFCVDPSKCRICVFLAKPGQRLNTKALDGMRYVYRPQGVDRAPAARTDAQPAIPAPEETAPMPKAQTLAPAPLPETPAALVPFVPQAARPELKRGDWARLANLEAAGVISTEEAKRIGAAWVGEVQAVKV